MKNSTFGWFILILWLNWLYGRIFEAYIKNDLSTQFQFIELSYSLFNLFILYRIYSVTDINVYLKYFYFILVVFHVINTIDSILWLSGLRNNKFFNILVHASDIFTTSLSYFIVTFLCLFIYLVFGK